VPERQSFLHNLVARFEPNQAPNNRRRTADDHTSVLMRHLMGVIEIGRRRFYWIVRCVKISEAFSRYSVLNFGN
jgi:hypothetical protein